MLYMFSGCYACENGLNSGDFCLKYEFLQVCHDEYSLKRARPRLSEQTQDEHMNARSSEVSQV